MKEKGKTIGLFVEPEDYEHYVSLGLRQRKEALAAAKTALLSVISKAGHSGSHIRAFARANAPQGSKAASGDQPEDVAITTPVVQQDNIDHPEGPATNIDAKGFLNGGW
jgi:hypothetical protein